VASMAWHVVAAVALLWIGRGLDGAGLRTGKGFDRAASILLGDPFIVLVNRPPREAVDGLEQSPTVLPVRLLDADPIAVELDLSAGSRLNDWVDERSVPRSTAGPTGPPSGPGGNRSDHRASPSPRQATPPGAGVGRRSEIFAGSVVRTQVFGLEGEGARFVYVFDRSGSMNSHRGRPLAHAKAELLRSLDDLDSVHQFQIIFYNEKPTLCRPRGRVPTLLWADELNKRSAQEFVLDMDAAGGTDHIFALRSALNLQPDVIFFLTDADEPVMDRLQLDEVRSENHGSLIHTIEFGYGPSPARKNFLTVLSAENGGQYVYIDMSNDPRRGDSARP